VDQQEIRAIYARQVDTVYRVCYTYMGNATDTEDAVQDVFLKLIRSGQRFNDQEHEKAWLIRVAANHCKDLLKAASRKNSPLDAAPEPVAPVEELDTTLEVVNSLEPKYREVIYLYYYEGYSSAEIARMLGQPASTVRNNLHDARLILRSKLGGDWR